MKIDKRKLRSLQSAAVPDTKNDIAIRSIVESADGEDPTPYLIGRSIELLMNSKRARNKKEKDQLLLRAQQLILLSRYYDNVVVRQSE